MCVTPQHLHRFVAGDRGNFLIPEAGFNQTRDRLVAEIVKAEPGNAVILQNLLPRRVEFIRPTLPIATRFAKEN